MGSEKAGAIRYTYSVYIGYKTTSTVDGVEESDEFAHPVLETDNWNGSRRVYEALTNVVDSLREVQGFDKKRK